MVQFINRQGTYNYRKRKYSLRQKIIIWYRIRVLGLPPICARYFPHKNKRILNREIENKRMLKLNGVIYHLVSKTLTAYVTLDRVANLSEIKISDKVEYEGKTYNVTEIGIVGFSKSSSLKKIFIPESITTIRRGAFLDCPNLESVSLQGNNKIDFSEAVFAGCDFNKLKILHRNSDYGTER